jgi:hypothetical protein
MAGRGPAPKPSNLRQRTNKKVGGATIEAPENPDIPAIENPDGRVWHPLTLAAWQRAWESPMASMWLPSDVDGLGRLALIWDAIYNGNVNLMAEARLQEARYGLAPIDRSRLQWEVARGEEAERKRPKPSEPATRTGTDPRNIFRVK